MEPTRLILLAEEDHATRAFLADNLTADGYKVLLADDKRSALAQLEHRQPDLVVCDVNGDTLALLDAVRDADGLASRILPDTPLIASPSAPTSSPACATSTAAATTSSASRSPTPSCAPGSARCCSAPTPSPPPGGYASDAHDRPDQPRGARPRAAGRAVQDGVRAAASARDRANTRHDKEELLRDVWGFRSRGAPGRSTRTPAACDTSSPSTAPASSSTCGAWATG